MIPARLCIEERVDPALALAHGQALLEATSTELPVVLYGATLAGSALVLGAHQRVAQALSPSALASEKTLRRRTGGVTVHARPGVLYLALGLHERSVLMPCPKQRILNRNVRGALQGLRLLGVPAHYFGRDFLSVDARPGVYVGWDAAPDGRVLIELFVSDTAMYLPANAHLGYPARSEDVFRGKAHTTLREAGARAGGTEVIEKIASGYASLFKIGWELLAHSPSERERSAELVRKSERVLDPEDESFHWSLPREDSIGFASAGVRLDGAGKLDAVKLAGDFFQDRSCPDALARTLRGVEPQPSLVGRAIDAVYASGEHELEGIRSLTTFQYAILEAAERARSARGAES